VKGLRVGEATISVTVDTSGDVTVEGLPSDFTLDLPDDLPDDASHGALIGAG
jgi:hypothetical protein